jgi:diguanylate cyclase (GGDEF)-like protein
MASKKELYHRYERLFVLAYAIVICLVLLLSHQPGTLILNIAALQKLAVAAVIYNIVFYFLLPQKYLGKKKTLAGIMFGILFISAVLWFSGYDESPFFFLYYLAILTAALYLGPRETMTFAIVISSIYLSMVRLAGRQTFSLTPLGITQLINMTGLSMITCFASVLAHLMKERERQARSKAEKFSALNVLMHTLTSTLEDKKIFAHVVNSISQLLNVPLCFLWTLKQNSNELMVCAGRTTIPLPLEARKLEVGQGLVGWAAAHRQMIILEDVLKDPRLQFREVARELGFASYVAIPMTLGERLMGVLEIGTTERREFSKDEIDLLLSFAAQSTIALNNSDLFHEQNERSRRLASLKKYRDVIQMALNADEVTMALTHALEREFLPRQVIVMKKNPSENRLEVCNLLRAHAADVSLSALKDPKGCLALRSSRSFVMNDRKKDVSCPQDCCKEATGSYLCLPLIVGGAVTGVVHLNRDEENVWNSDQISYAESFVDQTAPILSSLNLLQQAQQRAVVDSLTGLYNRRFLFEFLQHQIVQSTRYAQPLSVLMLDLDHFKVVNDTYGHEAGDLVLKLLALRLKESLRESDIAARYGGDEFVVVLPSTTLGGAVRLAEKILSTTREVSLAQVLPDMPHITLSAGVATCPLHGETIEQLQRAADVALYQAKQAGRDRVVAANSQGNRVPASLDPAASRAWERRPTKE